MTGGSSATHLAARPADAWHVPDWPAPAGVHALCTTRAGGVSQAPFDSLNLGAHVGDHPGDVAANRRLLHEALQATTPGARAVFLNQVHGNGVVLLDQHTPDGTEADGCATTAHGAVCTIMVADCLPVLLAHRSGGVVAAAHAGWRGLAGIHGQGVLEATYKQFRALALDQLVPQAINSIAIDSASVARETLAWLGPCIGPASFEVGADVHAAFCDAFAAAQRCFTPRPGMPGKYLCDLAGLARLRLQALGITAIYGNDGTAPWCTVSNPSWFFSHRRDSVARGGSGRFAACIWRG